MAKARKVDVVRGVGRFLDPHHLEVQLTTAAAGTSGDKKVVRFQKAIIAAGSAAVKLPFMPDDPRIVDSTGALELDVDPEAHARRSAAASSGSKWRPCIRRSARASTSSRCSTA